MPLDAEKERAVLALTLIAAKAKQLAHALQEDRLWQGDLLAGMREIQAQIPEALRPAGRGC